MINSTDYELQPLTPAEQPECDQASGSTGQFQQRRVSTTSKLADSDHTLLKNSSALENSGDSLYTKLKDVFWFSISLPLIDLCYGPRQSPEPGKTAVTEIIERHMQSLSEGDYRQFTSYTSDGYLSRTNENIFGEDQPLIASSVESSFTDVIKSIIIGHHNVAPADTKKTSHQPSDKATFAVKLARLLDLAGRGGKVRLSGSAVAQLDTPHIPTPETIIAQASLRVQSGEFGKEMLLSKLQSQCEQLADFLLKNAGMAAYVKSLEMDTPLSSGTSKAWIAARFISSYAAVLSNNVPPPYLTILAEVFMEKLSTRELGADAINDMMKAPALNISLPVRNKVVAYARNLYRSEKTDDVPGAKSEFSIFIIGSLQLLISQADKSDSNSELMDQCFELFLVRNKEANDKRLAEIMEEVPWGAFRPGSPCLLGILSVGLSAIMNNAYEVKDAAPEMILRDKIYSSALGKSFAPPGLSENAGCQEAVLQQSLIKKILNQPLSGKEKNALEGLTTWGNIAPIVNAVSNFGKNSADSQSLSRDQLARCIDMAVGNLKLEAYEHSAMPIPNSTGRYVDELVQGVIDRMLDNSVPGELFTMGSEPEEAGLPWRQGSANMVDNTDTTP